MISTIISQNSFDNSWYLPPADKSASFLNGVVLDISVTAPAINPETTTIILLDEVSISADGCFCASLVRRDSCEDVETDTLLGTIKSAVTGTPVAFDCIDGAHATILLGYIPKSVPTESTSVQISPDLITLYNSADFGQGESSGSVSIYTEENDDPMQVTLNTDKHIKLINGLTGDVEDGVLKLSADAESVTSLVNFTAREQINPVPVIRTINGVHPAKDGTILLDIALNGDVEVLSNSVEASGKSAFVMLKSFGSEEPCDGVDTFDSYIGPASPHEGVLVLDEAYDNLGRRDYRRLLTRPYRWNDADLKPDITQLMSVDGDFDCIPEVVQ